MKKVIIFLGLVLLLLSGIIFFYGIPSAKDTEMNNNMSEKNEAMQKEAQPNIRVYVKDPNESQPNIRVYVVNKT